MAISKEDIKKAAELSKINVDGEDIDAIYPNLNYLISLIDEECSFDNNSKTEYITLDYLREDNISRSFDKNDILKNSDKIKHGCLTVSKMME